jgi:hypothetical protein
MVVRVLGGCWDVKQPFKTMIVIEYLEVRTPTFVRFVHCLDVTYSLLFVICGEKQLPSMMRQR